MDARVIAAQVDDFWKRWRPSQKHPQKKTFLRDLYRFVPEIARLSPDDLQRVLNHVQTNEMRDLLTEKNHNLTIREVTEWYNEWRKTAKVDFAKFVRNRYGQNVPKGVLCMLNQDILVAYLEQEDRWPEWALQHAVSQYLRSYAKVRDPEASFSEYLEYRAPTIAEQLLIQGKRLDDLIANLNQEDRELWRAIHSRPITPDQINPRQIYRISALYCQDERLSIKYPFPDFVTAILQKAEGRLDKLLSDLESGSIDVHSII